MTAPVVAPAFTYRAQVVRWVDGDTVDLRVDLGFYASSEQRCRLLFVDTPERGQPGQHEATAFSTGYAPPGTPVVIRSEKGADKYGRFLVELMSPTADRTVNVALIEAGLAKPYFGGKKES
ncbi:nuclease [Arthrobacter phage Abba]|uniref:Nuclease n=1 Tax=Arthrobacter phage Abba TaxID=2713256 RepID=A0A6G8R2F2_9CAUD|nr:endonuclease [Arthrobacter phage Abba]QIN94356.1 nuclease [Arthrobacter phage Abba]